MHGTVGCLGFVAPQPCECQRPSTRGLPSRRSLSANVVLSAREYPAPRAIAFYRDMVERIRALPGVTSVGAISALPLMRESDTTQVHLESDTQYRLTERPVAAYRNVTTGYFPTMEIALLAGRVFDNQESGPVAVVSEGLARRLWPDVPYSAVPGRRVRPGDISSAPVTIVGVVGDARTAALDRDPFPVIYRPHAQAPSREMSVVVRTGQTPDILAASVRSEVWKLDKNLPAPTVRTMKEIVSASLAQRRFQTTLIVLFGVLALALAVVGIFGVTNYAVARQTREIASHGAWGEAAGCPPYDHGPSHEACCGWSRCGTLRGEDSRDEHSERSVRREADRSAGLWRRVRSSRVRRIDSVVPAGAARDEGGSAGRLTVRLEEPDHAGR